MSERVPAHPVDSPARRRLLLFSTKLGYQAQSFRAAAKKLAVQTVAVTDRCRRLEDPWGDAAIPVSFERSEEAAYKVMEGVRGERVDGVVALGDRPAAAAAYVARGLGIAFHHPLAVDACRSKLRTREILHDVGLPVPWFKKVATTPAPEPSLLGIQYPCVLKPLSLSASQGVIRANNRDEFLEAAKRINQLLHSPEIQASRGPYLDQLLVEGYIGGSEVAVEGLMTEGDLRFLAVFDKPDPLEGPYFEETIYVTPSRLPAPQQQRVMQRTKDFAIAMGLSHGPIHAEFRVNEEGIWPLEIAPRPIGGLCAGALRFGPEGKAWISLEELLLRHAVGLPGAGLPREESAAGVMMIPVPGSGIFESISGENDARHVPGITDLQITARLHDHIAAWPEGSSYLGFIFSRAERPAQAEAALREAHSKLTFRFSQRLPVEHPMTRRP